MAAHRQNIYLAACLVLLQISGYLCQGGGSDADEIDAYIYGLDYNRDEVLAYHGETVSSFPTEGHIDSNKNFIVVRRTKKTLDNNKADLGVISSNEHRTYPGALLLANSRLIDNAPDIVRIDRAEITYTVNLPGMSQGEASFSVVPTYANYKAAHDQVLNTWFEKYSDTHDVIAQFQTDYTMAYSEQQLRVKFGLEFAGTLVEAGIDFENVNNQTKLVMIHRFKQIFYTVSAQSPSKPSAVFGPDATVSDVRQKINEQNPPVLVDSVSYGRVIYVKTETTSTDNSAKVALETGLKNFNLDAKTETELSTKLENLNFQVYILGGGLQQIELVNAKTFEDVNEVIINFSKFSRTNLGYPMSYSSEFLKDNSRAVVLSSTEYTETTSYIYNKGIVQIIHQGGYVAQWSVTWDEIDYDENGEIRTSRRSWYKNWNDLTAPFNEEITLAGNCRNIAVYARACTFLAWEWWRTVIDRKGIPLINHRSFKIWGAPLSAGYAIQPPV